MIRREMNFRSRRVFGMGILRTVVQEHGRFVRVQLLSRIRADGEEEVRGQQPDTTVPSVFRAGQVHHENGLQVPEPNGRGERDVGQWHGLSLRVEHVVLVGREIEEDQVRSTVGREKVRSGR